MQEENKTIVTPEGYTLRYREEETVELKLEIPKRVLSSLESVAENVICRSKRLSNFTSDKVCDWT
jgi:hypothetical protein